MTNPVAAIQKLYSETIRELKKCTWPTRKELFESTRAVISGLVIMTVVVAVLDGVFAAAVRLIAGMN
ncbi:MAG: preprotein translocase subunit SecE [Victivallales bacterium]|nr:preprotein translocase subunit SecE [Victivallales bacterium]MBR4519070.1 preprotein translocase subunit SecE [Victivallales bacterium]